MELEKMKQTLREAIALTKLKNENLIHNYISHCIEDKQLYVLIDYIDLVNKYSLSYYWLQIGNKFLTLKLEKIRSISRRFNWIEHKIRMVQRSYICHWLFAFA